MPALRRCACALILALALPGCTPAPTVAPEPPPAAREAIRAAGLLRLGSPEAALPIAEAAVAADDRDLWAHRLVQDASIALGRGGENRARYDGWARRQPDDAMVAYLAGRAALPDEAAARVYFEEAVRLDPTFPWGTIGLARIEVVRGDLFRAIEMHREALERTPDDPDLQMSLGFLCVDLRLVRDATSAFERALVARPWDPRLLGGMGQALAQLDRTDEAAFYLQQALEIDPSRTDLMGALAYARFRAGDAEGAWRALTLQQEIDGSADPILTWRLEAELGRRMPQVAQLGPLHLAREGVTP